MQQRLVDTVGEDDAVAFVEDWREAFIGDNDIAAIASLGLNVVRVPLNHAVLEIVDPDRQADVADDTFTPREEGFALLDTLIERCRRHGVRVIFDLHAAPGGQSGAFMADPDDGERL